MTTQVAAPETITPAQAPAEVPPEAPQGAQEPPTDAEKTRHDIFAYSMWLHHGEGAEECEDKENGKCKLVEHFHAWIRLPNPFQVRDIQEKARAAGARRRRLLSDADSDAAVILDAELDEMRDDAVKPVLVDEILDQDFQEVYSRALREVGEIEDESADVKEDEDVPKLYENVHQDREEYQRLQQLPEDERPEEFESLEKHLADYSRAVEDRIKAIQQPQREHLMGRSMDDLVKIVRKARVDGQVTDAYVQAFRSWTWFVCTYRHRPITKEAVVERVWRDFNHMKYETDSEVLALVRDSFEALEGNLARARMAEGN